MLNLKNELHAWSANRRPLLGIDFDGTLVGFDPDPARVHLSRETLALLERLAKKFEIAFISGRALNDLRQHIPLTGVHFIGNHGCQILRKDGTEWNWRSPEWHLFHSTRLPDLQMLVSEHGGWIEDKFYSLTIHFRGARDENWWLTQGGIELEKLHNASAVIMPGKKVWNIIPVGAPDKGTTATKLCREISRDSLIYFGDEETDENIFRVREIPVFGVKIGEGETAAGFRLAGPSEVLSFLETLESEN